MTQNPRRLDVVVAEELVSTGIAEFAFGTNPAR
jgi:hypothetical protein